TFELLLQAFLSKIFYLVVVKYENIFCFNSLKELLRAKLIECGWKDQLKAHCKEVIKEKGLEHVTVDDLVAEITPKGRALVPDSVKKELLQRIRTFLAQHASL
uniref:Transcription and mRNA export factor ENY2 n=1 Tax=Neovison vison TaxID=452646 RepID=A0A8C7A6Y7_NEOVI